MLTAKELRAAFQSLRLGDVPVIAHASLSSFGQVDGGAPAVVEALLDSVAGVMVPVHTYVTMVSPLEGPPLNGIAYENGAAQARNLQALFYNPDLPADGLMGQIAEALRVALATTHTLVEGAGAAGLAGLFALRTALAGKAVGVVLSGANIDAETLGRVLSRRL